MKVNTPAVLKFKRFASRLGLRHYEAVGVLEALWVFTAGNADDGDLSKFSRQDLAFAIEWPEDDADRLIEALVACRWLDEVGESLRVHDWDEHQPDFVRKRRSRREKTQENQGAADNGGQRRTTDDDGGKRRVSQGKSRQVKASQVLGRNDAPASPKRKPKRSRRAPEDLAFGREHEQAALDCGLPAQAIGNEWAKFRDHEFASPRSDWLATWRNWCRKAAEMRSQRVSAVGEGGGKGSFENVAREAFPALFGDCDEELAEVDAAIVVG